MPKDSQRSSEEVLCDICGTMIRARGLVSHMRKCEKQERLRIEQAELAEILQESAKTCEYYFFGAIDLCHLINMQIAAKSLVNLTNPCQVSSRQLQQLYVDFSDG